MTRLGQIIRKIEKIPRYRMFNMIKQFKLDENYRDSYKYSDKMSNYDLQKIILHSILQLKIGEDRLNLFIDEK